MLKILFYSTWGLSALAGLVAVCRIARPELLRRYPFLACLCASTALVVVFAFLPWDTYLKAYGICEALFAVVELLAVAEVVILLSRHFPNFKHTGRVLLAIAIVLGCMAASTLLYSPELSENPVYEKYLDVHNVILVALVVCLVAYFLLIPHVRTVPIRPAVVAYVLGLIVYLLGGTVNETILRYSEDMTIRWLSQTAGLALPGSSCVLWAVYVTPRNDVQPPLSDTGDLQRWTNFYRATRKDLTKPPE